jgi:hypothetical protein
MATVTKSKKNAPTISLIKLAPKFRIAGAVQNTPNLKEAS